MMYYFGVLVFCVACYGVSGFTDDFMDNDKLVIPLKASTKIKPIEMPRHKMNMKLHEFSKIKPDPEESSNHGSPQSKFSKVQFSSSSFSSHVVSSNGNTQETEASSKTHGTSIFDGNTQFNQTESKAQAKENKSINGRSENRESVAVVKEVAKKNSDGSVQTIGTAVGKAAISHTADGETKRQEVKAATMAETVKDAAGEEHSKVIGLAQAEETKTNNGQNVTTKTLAVGESELLTHGDGKSERTDKFVVLLPDSKEGKLNNNGAIDTEKENQKTENDNKDTSNKRINYSDLCTDKKPENGGGSNTDDKLRKGSRSLDKPSSKENRNNKDTKPKDDKSKQATNKSDLEEETKEKETNTSKNIENDTVTQSKDKDSDRITEGETSDTSDDEDETDKSDDTDTDSDSESDTDSDDEDSVKTHDVDDANTGREKNKNDDSGVNDPKAKELTKTETKGDSSQTKRVSKLTVTQAGSTTSQ